MARPVFNVWNRDHLFSLRPLGLLSACVVGLLAMVTATRATANQLPAPPAPVQGAAGTEVSVGGDAETLLRGPIHEAFATQVGPNPEALLVAPKAPPDPISEVPPDSRPRGNNISWIPGYSAWDEHREDFIWVSGVWRTVPPGRRWVPGYWDKAEGGWRWHGGAWVRAEAEAIGYLPPPRQSLEQGPSSPSPSTNHFWVPGSWDHREGQYHWRTGFWAEGRPGWCWIPEHYIWSPRGVLRVDGYWDYELAARGTLFAPVALGHHAGARADFRYTPHVIVDPAKIFLHLFVRPGYRHYYFGDYYGDASVQAGIHPWHEFRTVQRGVDPLLSYYVWNHARQGINLVDRLTGWHSHFLATAALRPPHTLAAVGDFVALNRTVAHVDRAVLGQPLRDVLATADGATRFVGVTAGELTQLTKTVESIHRLADLRRGIEAGALAGDVVPGAVQGVVGASAEAVPVLKLPAAVQPLHGVAPGLLPTVPGVEGTLPRALPAVPPVERVLPVEPPVPLLQDVPGGLLN
ncbi:MAG: hypothetical protein U1E05_25255 [Patescibacteria group bacterium]|nr:hypothetical protein [Patescibacteria group bacterium]